MGRSTAFIPTAPECGASNYKDIVREQKAFVEALPLPVVTYPDVYGTWIAFQENERSQPMLCECQRTAAGNSLKLILQQWELHPPHKPQNLVEYCLPLSVRGENRFRAETLAEFRGLEMFAPRICHFCQQRVPSVRWSNDPKHSVFLQHFGWYFRHALLAAGVCPYGAVLAEELDPSLRCFIEVDCADTRRQIHTLLQKHHLSWPVLEGTSTLIPENPDVAEAKRLHETLKRQKIGLETFVENALRTKSGFPVRGKTGTTEALLGWILTALLGPVQRRVRLPALEGLELDFYAPTRSLAVEYQGEQHYRPFRHLGGETAHRETLRRDRKKAKLCAAAGISLLYFTPADKLTEEAVAAKLSSVPTG